MPIRYPNLLGLKRTGYQQLRQTSEWRRRRDEKKDTCNLKKRPLDAKAGLPLKRGYQPSDIKKRTELAAWVPARVPGR